MPATIEELIEQAESLLRKKIAIKQSVPGVFESMANIDDLLRITINSIISSGEEDNLSQAQINLVNSALSGTRTAIASYENDYTPTVNDLTDEFELLSQIDLSVLKNEKIAYIDGKGGELYDSLKKGGVIKNVDWGTEGLSKDDLTYLSDKTIISDFTKNSNYFDDRNWQNYVAEARAKLGALYDNLELAAKYLQVNFGSEFNVKDLNNVK